MAAVVPKLEPETVVAGDTVEFTISEPDYLPGDGWALSYHILNASEDLGQIDATDNGDGSHLVTITAATTAAWEAGHYSYRGFVTKAGVRKTVREGSFDVEPNFATVDTAEGRTFSKRMLDAIRALLEGKATKDQKSYQYRDRALSRYDWDELERLEARFASRVRQEESALRRKKGLDPQTTIKGAFSR